MSSCAASEPFSNQISYYGLTRRMLCGTVGGVRRRTGVVLGDCSVDVACSPLSKFPEQEKGGFNTFDFLSDLALGDQMAKMRSFPAKLHSDYESSIRVTRSFEDS